MARPAIEPATPEKEFRREMVIGISAPPTRIAKIIPAPETRTQAMMIPVLSGGSARMTGRQSRTTRTRDKTGIGLSRGRGA